MVSIEEGSSVAVCVLGLCAHYVRVLTSMHVRVKLKSIAQSQ